MREIKKIERYIPKEYLKDKFVMYTKVEDEKTLIKLGFEYPFKNNEKIIPNPINRALVINAVGRKIVRRDLPKITYTISWIQEAPSWGGPKTHTVYPSIDKEKYQVDHLLPLECYFILVIEDENYYVYSEYLDLSEELIEKTTMVFNMFRFTFTKEPSISLDYKNRMSIKIITKSWEFLKSGLLDEEIIKNFDVIPGTKKSDKHMVLKRLEYLLKFSVEDEIMVGSKQFLGYFCIKTKNHYVFECVYTENATYIIDIDDSWEEISKLTKTQIINDKLAQRLYHTKEWEERIKSVIE